MISDPQSSRTPQQDQIARFAIWLTCPDCNATSRVLALMASRVLQQRLECGACHSTRAPLLTQAHAGAHIPAPDPAQSTPNEDEQARLQTWIDQQESTSGLQHGIRVFLHRIAARFSRTKRATAQTASDVSPEATGLGLTHSEHDVL